MSDTVGDFLLQRLSAWGVQRVFGYPGDGINGIMGAFGRYGEGLRFVQARHEELAAFMACAHAKFTGEVGVCLATSGPGAIHLLNGLYDAKLDHQPVVTIIGQQSRAALGGDYQQEVDLLSLFKDVAHEFVHMVTVPEQVRHVVDRAMRIARDRRTVTCIIFPNDVQDLPYQGPPREHGTIHSGIGYTGIRIVPREEDLVRAAAILNAGQKVAMLVGAGALSAGEYGYDLPYFRRLLEAGAVDILQADATRCGGVTGFLGVAALYEAFLVPLSSHCAPCTCHCAAPPGPQCISNGSTTTCASSTSCSTARPTRSPAASPRPKTAPASAWSSRNRTPDASKTPEWRR